MATLTSSDFFQNEMFEECSPMPLEAMNDKKSMKKCWHSISDVQFRRELLIRLFRIVCASRSQMTPGTLNLCCRLEKQLYHRAASQEEYCQLRTLKRRLKSLAFSIADLSYQTNNKRFVSEDIKTRRQFKRIRRDILHVENREISDFLVYNNDRAIELVYSYLEPLECVKHRTVNRFAAFFLVNCVKSLSIDILAARRALSGGNQCPGEVLASFPRLSSLTIYNSTTRPVAAHEDISNLFEFCPNLSINTEDRAEDVALLLSDAISSGALPKLECLHLNSVFINSTEHNGVARLANALRSAKCPELKDLQLGGNCAGDDAAIAIAQLMVSRACKNLAHIDLRNNFIGQRGGAAIAAALADTDCIGIENLCLGGNILIDSNFADFAAALSTRKGKRPRFIGLEGNFISYSAMIGLSNALSSCNIIFVNRDDNSSRF